jgi:hypothetical protein
MPNPTTLKASGTFTIDSGYALPRQSYNRKAETISPYRKILEVMQIKQSVRITNKRDLANFQGMASAMKKKERKSFTFRTLGPNEWRVWRV